MSWNSRSLHLAGRGLFDAAAETEDQEDWERRDRARELGACPNCFELEVEHCEACDGTGEAASAA